MRWSRSFIRTLRDNPADAEIPSHQLLIRGGFIRQLAAGIYSYLPMGLRTLLKIESIVREEFSNIGAQEFLLPNLHPADLLQETGRWEEMSQSLFRLRDRTGRVLCLGTANEEVVTEIARKELRSYKDLPQIWYQIQAKFRDEVRLKSGPLRPRQFITVDSFSFDADKEGLGKSYLMHHDVCRRILTRCGMKFVTVEAASGDKAVGPSQQFMVRIDAGEDLVVSCECGYAANLDVADSRLPRIEDTPAVGEPREVFTPGQKTIADIAEFLHVPATHQIKSLVYMIDEKPHLFLVRGDHQLNEAKVAAALKTIRVRPARAEEIPEAFGSEAGSLGPVGVDNMPIYADRELQGRQNLTCGANRNEYHLQGVTPELHFKPIWTSLRTVEQGEACVKCGKPLEIYKASEVGRIFKLGTRYSESMGATVLTADGRQTPIAMGGSVMGLERIMCSVVEICHDENGILWPPPIAPFSVIITPINYKNEIQAAADTLYAQLWKAGLDVLLDDRAERPGVKFKDADLIGVPYRVVIGAEKLKQGKVELFERATKRIELLDLDSIVPTLSQKLAPTVLAG